MSFMSLETLHDCKAHVHKFGVNYSVAVVIYL